MQMKWDIVENVALEQRVPAVRRIIQRARGAMTTGLVLTLMTVPAIAARPLVPLQSDGQYVGQIRAQESEARAVLRKQQAATSEEDTSVGMSTRRLAEVYDHLFRQVTEKNEKQMEYSFF